MRLRNLTLVFTCLLCLVGPTFAQTGGAKGPNSKLQSGPSVGSLGSEADVKVPKGYVFANASDTRRIMEAMQNPVSGEEMGLVAPENTDWFMIFEYEGIGYVKDDEKNSLDANAMLEAIKKGNEAGNEERRRKGWDTMTITGWEQAPRYNPATHNLEWAIRGASSDGAVVNWNTRLLGRNGVMKVTLVADPAEFAAAMTKCRSLLAGFTYKQGHRYTEFRQGDKIAQYGLTALVVGGAAAVAAKSGLFKVLGKFVIFIVIGIGAAIKGIFGRKKSAE
jgi:uncharacterized membrane-anchored protein